MRSRLLLRCSWGSRPVRTGTGAGRACWLRPSQCCTLDVASGCWGVYVGWLQDCQAKCQERSRRRSRDGGAGGATAAAHNRELALVLKLKLERGGKVKEGQSFVMMHASLPIRCTALQNHSPRTVLPHQAVGQPWCIGRAGRARCVPCRGPVCPSGCPCSLGGMVSRCGTSSLQGAEQHAQRGHGFEATGHRLLPEHDACRHPEGCMAHKLSLPSAPGGMTNSSRTPPDPSVTVTFCGHRQGDMGWKLGWAQLAEALHPAP